MFQGIAVIDLYELKVLNALLKTGILLGWSTTYQNRYNNKLREGISSKDLSTRVLCTECIGIGAIYDYDQAENTLREMMKSFNTQDEPVQCSLIAALTDIQIEHGDQVDALFSWNSKQPNFAVFLSDIVVNAHVSGECETMLRAVEAISRLFLNTKIDPNQQKWQRTMVTLMTRASYAITNRFSAKVRSTIIVMLKFFCSINK